MDRKHIFIECARRGGTLCTRANNVLCLCRERYRIAFSYQPRYRYRLELFSMLRAIAPEVRYYSSLNPLADSRIRNFEDKNWNSTTRREREKWKLFVKNVGEKIGKRERRETRSISGNGHSYTNYDTCSTLGGRARPHRLVIGSVWHLNIVEATSNNMPAYLPLLPSNI